jgi:hypothetical protein
MKSDSKTRRVISISLKNQTKHKKTLEIKRLQVLQKTHADSKSPEQERKPKNTPSRDIPQIFNRKENQRSGDIGTRALQHYVKH